MKTPAFLFQHRTVIDFGAGSLSRLGDHVRGLEASRVLVVCDPGIVEAGIAERAERALSGASLHVRLFSAVTANPRDEDCQAAAAAARDHDAGCIVGVGGGSALDTAKAAAALVVNGGAVKDWEDPRRLDRPPLPTVCVPTTAGTGSEVTFVAVITDERERYEMTLLDPRLAPNVAVLDPELALCLPPHLTAATGMDALTHAVEAYTGRAANPLSDTLAVRAAELVRRHLERAVACGDDRDARSGMLLGSLLAGMAFGNSDVGAVHCMGETLGGLYDTPHGVACAVFLPVVFAFNMQADPQRQAAVARALGVDRELEDEVAAAAGAVELRRLAESVGIPRLRDLPEVSPDDFPALARGSASHVCSPDNAREITENDYLALFARAWGQ